MRKTDKKKALMIVCLITGIALMAVPFLIRISDKRRADRYIREFEVSGHEKDDDQGAKDSQKASGDKEKTADGLPESAIGILEIESLDLKYPIFEGAGPVELDEGIGHLPETAGLLTQGNCVLAGHNGSRRGVFFTYLNQIQTGAEVRVTNKEKVTHTYTVANTYIAGPYDASVRAESSEECLTLFTCAYHGSQRFVVNCVLKDMEQDSSNGNYETGGTD